MEHSGRIILNLEGNGKSYFLWNGSETYYKKIREAFKDIIKDDVKDYSYFNFVILCAATLEYSLNYIITDYCLKTYGPEDCKLFIEGYINLSFKKKLLMIPSIISNGEFKFNIDKSTFKKLNELIAIRNKIMHGKEYLKEFDTPEIKSTHFSQENNELFEFEIEQRQNPIESLDKKICIDFGEALGEFKTHIMEPWFQQEMKENSLLVKNQYYN